MKNYNYNSTSSVEIKYANILKIDDTHGCQMFRDQKVNIINNEKIIENSDLFRLTDFENEITSEKTPDGLINHYTTNPFAQDLCESYNKLETKEERDRMIADSKGAEKEFLSILKEHESKINEMKMNFTEPKSKNEYSRVVFNLEHKDDAKISIDKLSIFKDIYAGKTEERFKMEITYKDCGKLYVAYKPDLEKIFVTGFENTGDDSSKLTELANMLNNYDKPEVLNYLIETSENPDVSEIKELLSDIKEGVREIHDYSEKIDNEIEQYNKDESEVQVENNFYDYESYDNNEF